MSSRPPDLRAAVVRLLAEAEAILAMIDGETVASPIAAPGDLPEWVSLDRAAEFRVCTAQTMMRLVIKHGLGVKVGGRWRVDMVRLRLWQKGDTDFLRLDPTPGG